MQITDVYELLERFDASNVAELALELDNAKLVLKKGNVMQEEKAVLPEQRRGSAAFAEKAMEESASKELLVTAEHIHSQEASQTEELIEIKAQIAGTFYREPSPDSAPFVQVGQQVKRGDTLALMEAMKMFSNVTAPVDGEIVEILAEDESIAEFEQVLIRMRGVHV